MIYKIIISAFVCFAFVLTCVNEPLEVYGTKGLCPTYSWNNGSAYSLRVRGDSGVVWAIHTPGANKLNSPIKHGEIPPGAELFIDPERLGLVDTAAYDSSLFHGERYKVLIMKINNYSLGEFVFYADSTK
jgi:hypothetical protein